MRDVVVVIRDDLDNSIEADQTVEFSIGKIDYEIDLSDRHAKEFYAQMAKYMAAARKVSGRQKMTRSQATAYRRQIRQWAVENGYEVSVRGQISAEVINAFRAANPKAVVPESAPTVTAQEVAKTSGSVKKIAAKRRRRVA